MTLENEARDLIIAGPAKHRHVIAKLWDAVDALRIAHGEAVHHDLPRAGAIKSMWHAAREELRERVREAKLS